MPENKKYDEPRYTLIGTLSQTEERTDPFGRVFGHASLTYPDKKSGRMMTRTMVALGKSYKVALELGVWHDNYHGYFDVIYHRSKEGVCLRALPPRLREQKSQGAGPQAISENVYPLAA